MDVVLRFNNCYLLIKIWIESYSFQIYSLFQHLGGSLFEWTAERVPFISYLHPGYPSYSDLDPFWERPILPFTLVPTSPSPSLQDPASLDPLSASPSPSTQDAELWDQFSESLDLSNAEETYGLEEQFQNAIVPRSGLNLPLDTPPFPFESCPWIAKWTAFRLYQSGAWSIHHAVNWLVRQEGKSSAEALGDLSPIDHNSSVLEMKHGDVGPELDAESDARGGQEQLDSHTGARCLPERTFGRIHFTATLERVGGKFRFRFKPPAFGPSYRLSRVCGSDAIIRVGVDLSIKQRHPMEFQTFFVGKTFDILGRQFQALTIKEDTVILVDVKEGRSLYELYSWLNPFHLNDKQLATKWAARIGLALSTTVPLLQVLPCDIHDIDDFDGIARQRLPGKIPDNQNMTDGCGYANAIVFRMAQNLLGLPSLPSALQIRLGGVKGMLQLHPNEGYTNDQRPEVWIRHSQRKIVYDGTEAPCQRILEIVNSSSVTTPGRLSPETIFNLHHNGVPEQVFINLVEKSMQNLYDSLAQWEGDYAMHHLYKNIFEMGQVLQMRKGREVSRSPQVKGFNKSQFGEISDIGQPLPWYPDPLSECPSTLEETILEHLRHGFTPKTSPILVVWLKCLLTTKIGTCISKCIIEVPMSARVHCIPVPEDLRHLLRENEVHFRSSKDELLRLDGTYGQSLGDGISAVLMRNPCKLPSDSQKVVIVDHPELSGYVDVLLMPLERDRSLCSLLSGGDYDGDRILVIWDPNITDTYEPSAADSDDSLLNIQRQNFHSSPRTVESILTEIPSNVQGPSNTEREGVSKALQGVIFNTHASPDQMGRYSNMHNKSIIKFGYGAEMTKRLGYMAATLLDQTKTGLRVRDNVLRDDSRMWDRVSLPNWVSSKDDKKPNRISAESLEDHFPSVIATILDMARIYREKLLKQFSEVSTGAVTRDVDLCAPWEEEEGRVRRLAETFPEIASYFRASLEVIERHVEACIKQTETTGRQFTCLPTTERQRILRKESQTFMEGPDLADPVMYPKDSLARLTASYAYRYDFVCHPGRGSRWPWNVAYGELCRIKSTSIGGKERAESIERHLKMSNLKGLPG
ncbi:hypothetical protein M408DRAFT_22990 [Serendipita vermifera MAFF 305830]|uniref:RNA-dependent RNA polymerase n=1 Tax=Serendipita vermifera MAFF 305830 TaxID=933852 RepID=A0A0C2XJF4_SERVB|nr:hypothetical protein M408DRAFT_22990 [Serendipita vermifera MAFF 305830]